MSSNNTRQLVFVCLIGVAVVTFSLADETDFDAGRAAFDQGDFARAVELFLECREAKPDDPMVAAWLGSAQLRAGRAQDAVATLREAVRLAPRDPAVRNNLGNALAETGDRDGAIASYRAALEADPNFEDARYNLALILAEMGQVNEAVALYKDLLTDPAKRARAHLTVGQLLETAGRTRNAVSHYQSAATFDPSLSEATRCLARALRALDERPRALALLETEAKAGRATPPLREFLGLIYQSQGENVKAEALLRALRDEGHDTFELHRALGMAQAALGDLGEAAASFQRALGHRPRDAETENNLGWVYAQQLLDDKAEEHLVAALESAPNLVAARKTLITIYRRQGRTREVVAQLEAILQATPDDAQVLRALARAALAVPDVRLDETTIERLTKLQSNDHAFLSALACLLIRDGAYTSAVRVLRRAIELNASSPNLHNNLGVAYERLGLLEEALGEYRAAVHLDPEHPEAQSNRDRIEAMLAAGRTAP